MAEAAKVRPFDGKNDFNLWKIKMKTILVKEKVWSQVVSDKTREKMSDDEKEKDEQAIGEM